jgi:glycosyltransferase involved in cell wall biosynthesis
VTTSLVTIGITCFNAADTIKRAVASALAQDWPNFELVIVDDASTDDSIPAIKAVLGREPRARLIRHDGNIGAGGARNRILAEARGEFIAFFDDDDESLPARIANQVKVLSEYENRSGAELVACFASGMRLYANGYAKMLPAIGSRGDESPQGPPVADYLLAFRRRPGWFYGSGTPACSLLARRSTFHAVDGFDVAMHRVEGADFAIRLALRGGHFIGSPETLFVQHATAGTDKTPEKNLEAEQCLVHKHRAYLQSVGLFEYARRWPKLRYWHFKRQYGHFLFELGGLFFRYPLATITQVVTTGPRRVLHEARIRWG